MRKVTLTLTSIFLSISLYTTLFVNKTPSFLYNGISNYTIKNLETTFGSQPLTPQFEQKIKEIAQKMGITEEIYIRKMNYVGLQTFGYYNAVYMTPLFLHLFPILDKPYIYVSQGLLENLTDEEQVFLIGHELAHLRERHVCYLQLIELLVNILLFAFWWFIVRHNLARIIEGFTRSTPLKNILNNVINGVLVGLCIAIPSLGALAYYRHIEWQADHISLSCLRSHDGALRLMDRWQKEYKIPDEQGYMDIFSNHPSTALRKKYCLEHKQQTSP